MTNTAVNREIHYKIKRQRLSVNATKSTGLAEKMLSSGTPKTANRKQRLSNLFELIMLRCRVYYPNKLIDYMLSGKTILHS